MRTTAPTSEVRGARAEPTRRLPHVVPMAIVAALVGVPLTGAGAGVAFRWLSKGGISATAVAGLVALLGGLALLVFSWSVFWRRSRRWQRLWFLPAAVVALVLMASYAMGAALAVAPRNDLPAATPAGSGLPYRDVVFRTGDGVELSAWWIPSRNGAAVVTLPGSGSTRAATLAQATVLARHGYGVLMVDPRGQGRSAGHAMDAGWWGDRDVAAAVTFLRQRAGIGPGRIGLLGLSMGGEQAIGAAHANGVRAVVAEGATHRTAEDKAGYLPGGAAGAVQRALDRLTYSTTALLSPAPQPGTLHAAVAGADGTSFLLIAGGDAVDEPEAAAYLRSAAPDRVRTWTVPGAGHTKGLTTSPAAWATQVTSFLDETLQPPAISR